MQLNSRKPIITAIKAMNLLSLRGFRLGLKSSTETPKRFFRFRSGIWDCQVRVNRSNAVLVGSVQGLRGSGF